MNWLLRLFRWLSQTANFMLLNGDPEESVSGRAWRQRNQGWRPVFQYIDSWLGLGHCRRTYEAQVKRNKDRNDG